MNTHTNSENSEESPANNLRPQLGLKENLFQFMTLAVLTFLVGVTIGVERVALPPLARSAFHITSLAYTVSFISAFGLVKSAMNLIAGRWSDRVGRKPLLLAGWAVGLAYPLLIIGATSWVEVVIANFILGINQALTWTMTVTAKIDLVGPRNRGFAIGLNESSGYLGVAAGGYVAGMLATAYGLRPAPYIFAIAVIVLGGILSLWATRETLPWAQLEARHNEYQKATSVGIEATSASVPSPVKLRNIFIQTSWRDKATASACQAGFINKIADTLVIGFLPLYLVAHHQSLSRVGLVVGLYAAVWGLGQIPSGLLADKIGRKIPIGMGQLTVAVAIVALVLSSSFYQWLLAAAIMGIGTALVYPNLISVIGDVAPPSTRGSSLGVYRLWRDGGYAIGPLAIALVAGIGGMDWAFWFTASLNFASTVVVAVFMYETRPHQQRNSVKLIQE